MKSLFVIIGTNSYFPLAVRLMKKLWFIQGSGLNFRLVHNVNNPEEYLPKDIASNTEFVFHNNNSWIDACHYKYEVCKNAGRDMDYVYYMDADTNLHRRFSFSTIQYPLLGAEHFGNNSWMKDKKNFDRNDKSSAYIPFDTPLPQMYYQGAFFGGVKEEVEELCSAVCLMRQADQKINYEPSVNDESYLNKYFHHNPPTVINLGAFPFAISDKGGITDMRNIKKEWANLEAQLRELKDDPIEIRNGSVFKI